MLVSSLSLAQAPSTPPPTTQPAGQPNMQPRVPGPGQPGGPVGTPANANEIAQLLMRGDKNGDGKLSVEEIPAPVKDRFGAIDTDKDGLIDQQELIAFAKTQDKTGNARRGGGGSGQNFEGAMKLINRGFKALEISNFDAASKAQDLANIQLVEAGIVNAKGAISTLKMAPQAKDKYGDDTTKYESDIRSQLLAALTVAIALENAVIRGDSAGAKELVAKLDEEEHEGHEMFRPQAKDGMGAESKDADKGKIVPVPPNTAPEAPK